MSKIRTQETGAGRDRVAKRENLPVDERATTSSSREKRADPRISFRFVSSNRTVDKNRFRLCFSESENRAKPNRSRGANEPRAVILDSFFSSFSMSFCNK